MDDRTSDKRQRRAKSTKRRLIRIFLSGLRWLAVIVLSGMIIGGLYVQAPWKVVALAAVLLAGLTVIRGRLRVYFWLGVAAVATGVIGWILIPEKDDGQWQRWPLDEEIAAFNARFAVEPEDNAAVIYNEVIESRDWGDYSKLLGDADPRNRAETELWTDDELPELAALLADISPELYRLQCAAKNEACFFDIASEIMIDDEQSNRRSVMRRLAMLLGVRSRQLSNPTPIDDAIVLVRMGYHLRLQPTFLDILVGLAVGSMGNSRLNEMIVNEPLSEEQLNRIEQAIGKSSFDLEKKLEGLVDYETLTCKDLFSTFYQKHPSGNVRFLRFFSSSHDLFDDIEINQYLDRQAYWSEVWEKIAAVIMWFVLPRSPEPIFEKIDTAFEPLYIYPPSKEPLVDFSGLQYDWRWNVAGLVEFSPMHTRSMLSRLYYDILPRHKCQRQGTLLLCELRRYKNRSGRWPDSLEDLLPDTPEAKLIDPVSGEWFVYERDDEGFIVYSAGMEMSKFDTKTGQMIKQHEIIEIWPE